MNRRKLIGGLGLLVAAPAIVKISNIMRVKPEKLVNPCAGVITGIHGYTYCPGHGYKVGDLILMHFSPMSTHKYTEVRQVNYVDDKGFVAFRPPMPEANWVQL